MSITVDISERSLRIGIVKLAISLVMVFTIFALVLSLVAERGQSLAVSVLMVCVAFAFLTNGFLAILKIIDWFEARKVKSRG